jgi:hypothetical protein
MNECGFLDYVRLREEVIGLKDFSKIGDGLAAFMIFMIALWIPCDLVWLVCIVCNIC